MPVSTQRGEQRTHRGNHQYPRQDSEDRETNENRAYEGAKGPSGGGTAPPQGNGVVQRLKQRYDESRRQEHNGFLVSATLL
jgi:hypothetical protein